MEQKEDSVIKGSTAGLWTLYREIGNAQNYWIEDFDHTRKTLISLRNRLQEVKNRVNQMIAEYEQMLAELQESLSPENQSQIAAFQKMIQQLEEHKTEICHSMASCEEYLIRLDKQEEKNKIVYRQAKQRVNQYLLFLEIVLAADQMERSDQEILVGTSKYRSMYFRGIQFYCNDDEIDIHLVDKKGRTNLQRMQEGKAPIGRDGRSINLHHMQQSDRYGSIIELSETTHQKGHKPLHVNTHDIPSGINRETFEVLKKAYWRTRAKMFTKKRKN